MSFDTSCFNCKNCAANIYDFAGEAVKGSGSECYKNDIAKECSDADCSLSVLVVWSGTDSAGNYLLSQQKRPSNFELTYAS